MVPKKPFWEKRLSEVLWINSVAISNDGNRVIGATFLHDYRQRTGKFLPNLDCRFGVYCFDEKSPKVTGTNAPQDPLWIEEYVGCDGIFSVAISGDGSVAAAGGWLEKTTNNAWGLIRAYDAADGKRLLDYTSLNRRASWIALSENGGVLTAVADDVYVFIRDRKAFNPVPLRLGVGGIANRSVASVAVHPSGTWLAACDQAGHVHMATIDNGEIQRPFLWTSPEEIPFLSVAIARDAETFVVGGGNFVYLFDFAYIRNHPDSPIEPVRYDTTNGHDPKTIPPNKPDGRLEENVRWVAITNDGKLLTAAANRLGQPGGLLVALTMDGRQLRPVWQQWLDNNPNSTSTDANGRYVTACDGYPTGKPAKFYLFDAKDGKKVWDFGTHSMNWPMVISADASAIIAGSDDGTVYNFKP